MTTLKTCTAYLSMQEEGNQIYWRLLIRNEVAAEGWSLREVLAVARGRLGVNTVAVWDRNRGEFTSEMVTDERV